MRLPAVLAVSAVVALLAAVFAHGTVKPVAAAATHVFVDTATPSVVHRPIYPVSALIDRAELLGRVMTSPPVVGQIARHAGVPTAKLAAEARTTAHVPAAYTEPRSEERASAIPSASRPYRIEVEARQTTPVLDVYTHAPSTAAAVRLANAAVAGITARLQSMGDAQQLPANDRLVLRQLGPARGGVPDGGMAAAIAAVTFIVVFGLTFAGLRYMTRETRRPAPACVSETAHGTWPHTTRLTPWMFALFLAMVWLMPFDEILLKIHLPIDLSLDRLLLPVVVATWLLALIVGGGVAPRWRPTRIHVAVGAFVTCAFASVILNAGTLSQTFELAAAVKALPLLVSYVSVFVIASTAVRSDEVRAFLGYILGLAVICAVGVLWEYRFKQNLFFQWSDKLLPGIFQVPKIDSAAVDDIGRRVVQGPAAVPLETVAMLSMALPIPIVRATQAERPRDRLLYGLAACLLFAAAFATFRKSALVAPLSVIVTIAYFRRRELLKLAPLGLALVVLIPILAPGAVGMTTTQFEPGRLGVATVSDRASDYDAVRPDVWTHLIFGRGWGTYDHLTYRVLDSEVLHRLIEMGVLGLLAYLFMIGSVIWTARGTIAERDRTWAPLALVGSAAAVAFGVMSTLFDAMSFPHGVYIFLCIAGLVATVVSRREAGSGRPQPGLAAAPEPELAPLPRDRATQPASRAGAGSPSPDGVGSTSS